MNTRNAARLTLQAATPATTMAAAINPRKRTRRSAFVSAAYSRVTNGLRTHPPASEYLADNGVFKTGQASLRAPTAAAAGKVLGTLLRKTPVQRAHLSAPPRTRTA